MAKVKCPKCQEKMDIRAEVCPHCRSTFTPDEVAKRVSDQNRSAAIGCVVLVLLVGSCVWMFDGSDNSSEAVAEAPAATAKADAIGFYHDVMSAIGSCDRAGGAVSNAGQSGDMVALYQAADAMEAACLSTSSDVRAIDVPKTVGKKVYEDLTNAREACENAYLNRWSAAGSMKEALDDMGSISRQAELRQASEATQAGILACAAGLMGGAMEAGATTEELGIGS